MRSRLAQELPQGNEAGILAVALARMNASLEHEQRNSASPQLLRRPRTRACYEQRAHRPALGRVAVHERVHSLGPAPNERFAQRLDLVESAGLTKIRALREGR